jgi:hypothetical protein
LRRKAAANLRIGAASDGVTVRAALRPTNEFSKVAV